MFKTRFAAAVLGASFLSCMLVSCQAPGVNAVAGWKGAHPLAAGAFHFVILSDSTGQEKKGELEEAITEINRLKPDFVISVGDFIEGKPDTQDRSEVLRMWREFEIKLARLDSPFLFVPGNHDINNDMMFDVYVHRHGVGGRTYYSFNHKGCHFVVLDVVTATRKKDFAAEQFAWLAKDLAAAKNARHVFVFYHYPLLRNDPAGSKELWPPLAKLLDPARTTIFNGHTHTMAFSRPDGIATYVLAATASERSDLDAQDRRAFMQVWVERGEPTIAVLPLHEVLPSDLVTQSEVDRRAATQAAAKQATSAPTTASAGG
jgi:predicted phosphodiesterase